MRTFIVENFKGNLIKSLEKIRQKFNCRIVEAFDCGSKLIVNAEDNQINESHKMTRKELDTFIRRLETGIVRFEYIKKDGRLRRAKGTRNDSWIPDDAYLELEDLLQTDRARYMIYYYDLDRKRVRQFHVGRFEKMF